MPPIPVIFAIAFVFAAISLRSKKPVSTPALPKEEDTAELIARALENYLKEKKVKEKKSKKK